MQLLCPRRDNTGADYDDNHVTRRARVTYLSFDDYVEGSEFLMVFLFDLDINDNCRYPIEYPTTGKWTTHTMKVTRGGKLKKGHKVRPPDLGLSPVIGVRVGIGFRNRVFRGGLM